MTRKMKWIVAILGVSLTLNVFALGLFIGKGFRPPHVYKKMARPSLDFNLKHMERHLAPKSRDKVRAILKKQHWELMKRYEDLNGLEKKIKALLSADTVDKKALKEALSAHAEQKQNLHWPRRRVMLEVIADMDLKARKKLAKDMFRKRGWKKKHMKKKYMKPTDHLGEGMKDSGHRKDTHSGTHQ
ncbi:MAG: periplasmic heavy metal sensor [Kordiimonadaceae bacterium]|nr:periplasmic heavy metal sensor [Kordiimonadaceae bacterium]